MYSISTVHYKMSISSDYTQLIQILCSFPIQLFFQNPLFAPFIATLQTSFPAVSGSLPPPLGKWIWLTATKPLAGLFIEVTTSIERERERAHKRILHESTHTSTYFLTKTLTENIFSLCFLHFFPPSNPDAPPTTKLMDPASLPSLEPPTTPFQRLRRPLERPPSDGEERENKKRRQNKGGGHCLPRNEGKNYGMLQPAGKNNYFC
jgi:hypothetical protein